MQHVNTGFYYGPNTLSSVSYQTTAGERKSKMKMPQGNSEMIVSPFVSPFFFFPHSQHFFGRCSECRDLYSLLIHLTFLFLEYYFSFTHMNEKLFIIFVQNFVHTIFYAVA